MFSVLFGPLCSQHETTSGRCLLQLMTKAGRHHEYTLGHFPSKFILNNLLSPGASSFVPLNPVVIQFVANRPSVLGG